MLRTTTLCLSLVAALVASTSGQQQADRLAALKQEVSKDVDARFTATQQMIDQVFRFGELGHQEVEKSKDPTGVLEKNGFRVERNIAGLPTGWVARWGSGRPAWDDADVTLAKAIQKELKQPQVGLETKVRDLQATVPLEQTNGHPLPYRQAVMTEVSHDEMDFLRLRVNRDDVDRPAPGGGASLVRRRIRRQ